MGLIRLGIVVVTFFAGCSTLHYEATVDDNHPGSPSAAHGSELQRYSILDPAAADPVEPVPEQGLGGQSQEQGGDM